MNGIVLSAPQIVNPAKDGAAAFINSISQNAAFMNLLRVLGGLVVVGCIILLLARKYWPTSPIGRGMADSGSKVAWAIVGIVLGVVLVAPSTVVPWTVALLATPVQWVLNVIGMIFGI